MDSQKYHSVIHRANMRLQTPVAKTVLNASPRPQAAFFKATGSLDRMMGEFYNVAHAPYHVTHF